MQFKLLTTITTLLAASSVQAAEIKASDITGTLVKVTDLSADTNQVAQSITSPFNVFSATPRMIKNFEGIVTKVGGAITMLDGIGNPGFSEDGQADICQAFTDFVKVHQQLLDTVIGKRGLLSATPFTAPVAAVLRLIEKGVDTLALSIIGTVPSCAAGAKKDLAALDASLDKTIKVYSN